jgi:hypothetical protein
MGGVTSPSPANPGRRRTVGSPTDAPNRNKKFDRLSHFVFASTTSQGHRFSIVSSLSSPSSIPSKKNQCSPKIHKNMSTFLQIPSRKWDVLCLNVLRPRRGITAISRRAAFNRLHGSRPDFRANFAKIRISQKIFIFLHFFSLKIKQNSKSTA